MLTTGQKVTSTDPADPAVIELLRRLSIKAAHGSRTASRLPPGLDADDLKQIALIAGVDALGRWRADGGASVGTFVFHRMRGAVLDVMRSQAWPRSMRSVMRGDVDASPHMARRVCGLHAMQAKPEAHLPAGFGLTTFDAPDAALLRRADGVRVRAAVLRLPPRLRRIVTLYFWRGLTMRQIGEQIGVNQSRVSQLCHAALDRLRRTLATPDQLAA